MSIASSIEYQLTANMLQNKIDEFVAKGLRIVSVIRVSEFNDPNMTNNPKANYLIITEK